MAGKRSFKKLTIDRSEGDTVTKTVRLAEGGAMGEFSVWNRRTAGTSNTTYRVFGSFVDNPTEDERYQLTWWYGDGVSATDSLDSAIWGWYTDFSYLTIEVEFENSEEPPPPPEDPEEEIPPVLPEPGTTEFYIVSY